MWAKNKGLLLNCLAELFASSSWLNELVRVFPPFQLVAEVVFSMPFTLTWNGVHPLLSLSLCLSLPPPSLSLSHCLCVSLCLCLAVSVCLSLCLCVCVCLSLSLQISVLSLSLSLNQCALSLSLPPSLFPPSPSLSLPLFLPLLPSLFWASVSSPPWSQSLLQYVLFSLSLVSVSDATCVCSATLD